MHKILALLAVAALAACTPTRPVSLPIPPGFGAVAPGGTMKVGHLYFSGQGRYPAFHAADGRLFSEFCWADFGKITALKDISAYVEEMPDPLAGYSGGADGSFSFGLPGIAKGEASADTTAKVAGIKRLTLNPEGLDIVLSNLGQTCRDDIVSYSKTYDVVLLMSAQRADTMTLSSKAKFSLEASFGKLVGLDPIKAGAGANQALEYQLVYLSSNLGSTEEGPQ